MRFFPLPPSNAKPEKGANVLELTMLHYAYLMMRSRLSLSREDEKGVVSLETVLWVAGLAVLAIATVAVITTRVNTATERIPTGPAAAP